MGNHFWTRRAVCFLFIMPLIAGINAVVVNVKTKGAKADGKTDDGQVILNAWKEACSGGSPPSSVLIPPGTYLAFPILMGGPCKGPIEIKATGATLKAPPELKIFKTVNTWITFLNIDRLTINGGTFDGQGHDSWRNKECPRCQRPVNIGFSSVRNSLIKNITSVSSKYFHLAIGDSRNIRIENITIHAPENSRNTDGIHIGRINDVNITNSIIKTGDDCISFGDGSKNIRVENVTCGPGHGISVGSLGKYPNERPVQGIWIKNCTLTGTQNGVRIKSWPDSTSTTVSDIHFEDIVMDRVGNPIIIDQEYCPGHTCKKGGPSSRVKISNVSFRRIRGTSTTKVALKLACSAGLPCENIELADINLTYQGPGGGPATSKCDNVKPNVVGQVVPAACSGGSVHPRI
ncbi:exopolygalacturonase [Lactuca sativa]|uniref:Polygalacturonase n=1 Tax=Lactuca sativa TaxID=4236 RepID=A0A9R1V0S5_LACSA|nr:exopolygalacturonase [Lactuca sativa]KAJ0196784.1 hypothetical protein LSAT_V11C700379930 [Lactuca sativa]